MAKINYSKLGLKVNKDVNKFTFSNQEIEVFKYLPIEDKYDLIMVTLQESKDDEVYNDIKLDMHFHLNLIYLYTNITFTDKQKEDEGKLYDQIKSSGFLDAFLSSIEENEYNELIMMMEKTKEDILKYNTTAFAVLSKFIYDLPEAAEAAANVVDTFDEGKYSQVVNFAKTAGLSGVLGNIN